MIRGNIELQALSALLARFIEHKVEIKDDVLVKSNRFLFHDEQFSELQQYPELYDTLVYLKDVKERNFLKDISGLFQYYEKKQQGIDELFDKYEQANAEEQLAIKFQSKYETFRKIQDMENHQKSESIYYPVSKMHYLVGYENISYRNSVEEEIQYLAQIKGNKLIDQPNVSRIASEKNKQLSSN